MQNMQGRSMLCATMLKKVPKVIGRSVRQTIVNKNRLGILLAIGALVVACCALMISDFFPDLNPVARSFSDPPPAEGPFAFNNLLDEAELLHSGLIGAECFAPVEDDVVTGLLDGRVMRIKENNIEVIIDCETRENAEPCGRPLGLRFRDNEVFVADSINGLFKINLTNNLRTRLYDASTVVGGKASRLTDDLVITRDGDVYFTDASTKWGFENLHLDFIEGYPRGRILHYDPRTDSTRLLLDQLNFPNGIQLSPDEDYFLFCESAGFRILKYHLRGPLRSKVELFADNLPGYPDNIRSSGRGTYWVALPILRVRGWPCVLELLAPYPSLLKVFARLPYLLALFLKPFEYLPLTNGWYSKGISLATWSIWTIGAGSGRGYVLELDEDGNVIRSLQASKNSIHRLSTALEHRGKLYLGSPWEAGVYKLDLGLK